MNNKNFSKIFSFKDSFHSLFSSRKEIFPALNGWRVLATIWLLCGHCLLYLTGGSFGEQLKPAFENHLSRFIMHAHYSVDMFFVISGFLIGSLLLRELKETGGLNLFQFYARRALRILPPYYFVIIFTIIFVPLFSENSKSSSMIFNFIYLNNFIPVVQQYMTWAWALAVEEQFYIILPLLLLIFRRNIEKIPWLMISLVSVCLLAQYFLLKSFDQIYYVALPTVNLKVYIEYFDIIYDKPYVRMSALFLGVLGAWIFNKKEDFSELQIKLIFISGLIMVTSSLGWMEYGIGEERRDILFLNTYRFLFSAGFLLVLFSSIKMKIFDKIFHKNLFYPLAQISYIICLIHPFVIFELLRQRSDLFNKTSIADEKILVFIGAVFIVSIICALPIYFLIERPFTNLRSYIPGRAFSPFKAPKY